MKFFCLENLSSQTTEVKDPRTVGPLPSFADKKEYREWCVNPSTRHCFFNAVEGLTPSLRITQGNPPLYMHGFVGDYDSVIDQESAKKAVEDNAPIRPLYLSQTFSGHARLVWAFAQPVLVDCPELAEKFLKLLATELKLNNVLPGFDSNSLSLQQYFEAGRDWYEFPNTQPIDNKLLTMLFFRAGTQTKFTGDSVKIDIEKVATEVEKRWPGRADIAVGNRVPLFWVEPFEDRVGAQVGEWGMICYSSRAGKSFVSWPELFGPDFMREFHQNRIGGAIENIWFDNTYYWKKTSNGLWAPNTKEDTGADLRVNYGLTKDEISKALVTIRDQKRVYGVFPFIYNKNDVVQTKDGPCLNISRKKVVQPAEKAGSFDWIEKFFENLFDPTYPIQRDLFLSWFYRLYTSALEGNLKAGQAVFTVGPTGQGKTLLGYRIVGGALGGYTDAAGYILGKTEFNKECAETAVWCVDDNRGGSTWEKHDELSNGIKRLVANPSISYHPKYRDASTITWVGRILVTCNPDAKSMSILPEIDESNEEKILLLRTSNWKPSFSMPEGIEARIEKELPFFLRWFVDKYKVPKEVEGDQRYGVIKWHHPVLLAETNQAAAPGQLYELMPLMVEQYPNDAKAEYEWMTASKIRTLLDVPGLRSSLPRFANNRLGIALSSPEMKYWVTDTRVKDGYKQYKIFLKP
jgi:uncharacterized protein DUF5906